METTKATPPEAAISNHLIDNSVPHLEHDGTTTIAVGKSRLDVNWQTGQVEFSHLCARLTRVTRTSESVVEYHAMSKDRQDDLKDIGGYVGGALDGTRRRADAVKYRSLLTLDADNAHDIERLWQDWKDRFGYCAALHTTRKHRSEAPRARLVVPATRPMTVTEFPFISRTIVETLGADQFDETTHQHERLMYWPSTSRDGQFIFKEHDAPWLDPDVFLAGYPDWRDRPSQSPKTDIARLADGAPEGTRDASLTSVCGHLLARRVEPHLAEALVYAYGRALCDPPVDDKQIEKVWQSIATRELRRRQRRRR